MTTTPRATRRWFVAVALVAGTLGVAGVADADVAITVTDGTVTSKAAAPCDIQIAYTLFQPATASADNPVPMIMHSHGWGGKRVSTISAGFQDLANRGFGVLSFDQRGWGDSTGDGDCAKANVQDPELEGYDVEALVDLIASLDWVRKDGPGDPALGAIGGSYGGGFQTVGALSEILHNGSTRFDALAPEITWNDLPNALAPQGVLRTAWNAVLYGVGAPRVPTFLHESFAYGVATGQVADGTAPEPIPNIVDILHKHSPSWFAENGYKLDIPVLFGQGTSDDLFILNEAVSNYQDVLTPQAQQQSYVVGYEGGHVLPEAYPASLHTQAVFAVRSMDACSGSGGFSTLAARWYEHQFYGAPLPAELSARFNLTSNDGGTCLRTDSIDPSASVPVQPLGTIATTSGPGAAVSYKLADGPITIAGIAELRGSLTTVGVDARAFFGLSVGATPASALVVSNNLLPIRRLLPVSAEAFSMELPGVAVQVPAGESLYLTVSPIDALFGSSRAPGAILIENATVGLPVL